MNKEIKSLEAEKQYWRNWIKDPKNDIDKILKMDTSLELDLLDLDFFSNKTICEIGCGCFGPIFRIRNATKRYGVDPLIDFYRSIGLIKNQETNLVLINNFAEDLSAIHDECIDLIILHNMLDHTYNPQIVIQEVKRVLKKSGLVYLKNHTFAGLLKPFRSFLKYIDKPHPFHFSIEDIQKNFKEKGFSVYSEKLEKIKPVNSSFKEKIGTRLIRMYTCIFKIS